MRFIPYAHQEKWGAYSKFHDERLKFEGNTFISSPQFLNV